jgi:phosphomannomutase
MIKFGTDGWRAKIADEFTFENVRLVSIATMNYLKTLPGKDKVLLIGYDNRFLSEEFAKVVAETASGLGVNCSVSSRSLSSPALSYAVRSMGATLGVMITASHNPPEYNGFKLKASYGGSASPEITARVENELALLSAKGPSSTAGTSGARIEHFDPESKYLARLKEFVDLDLISKANIIVVVDPMHGSASGYLSKIFKGSPLKVMEINDRRDPLFGGSNPEPLPGNLVDLNSTVKETSLANPDALVVGIALDGDGDRISAIDASGAFINPHNVFSILLRHLVEKRKMSGEVVKSFNITELIDKQAEKYGLKLHVTKIGFKYIADLMMQRDILIGGEESGGIGIKGHIPERDGTLNALLLLEAVAMSGSTLKGMLDDIMNEFGYSYYDRIDLHLTDVRMRKVIDLLKNAPPKAFANNKVRDIVDLDGTKLILEDGGWILFRASGTEPLLRIYAESASMEKVEALLAEGENLTK